MVRILIVMALLASLFYIVQNWQPVAEPTVDPVATTKAPTSPEEVADGAPSGFNPAVPESLPDVEKGYLFSEKRKVEKEVPMADLKPAVVEPGPEILDSVVYTGSVIIGDLRRALVTFQEPSREAAPGGKPPRPGTPRRPPSPEAAQAASQNKQLRPGERLLGFVLALVEPNRIVFEKGNLKVEKFLYDRNKKRIAAVIGRAETPPVANPGVVPPEAYAPPPEAPTETTAPPAMQSNRMVRRSQRLLGADSMIKMPPMPIPGKPVPNN